MRTKDILNSAIDRLDKELMELRVKFNKLEVFLNDKNKIKKIPEKQLFLLRKQYKIMQDYTGILVERIALARNPDKKEIPENAGKKVRTMWSDNDIELPYVFDLLFDIKTEAQLYNALNYKETGHSRDIDEIYSIALDYGYTKKYLSKYNN